ncbi:Flp family type IVb pilin [Bradyrhizobium sp. U87765 SZCCT0131]|uniref:Flp family type IVb pilin n=1 Tax=unclassified Bradyrhizobium TaxID=2631580 RepID=UPI001BA8D715|nr:MULTISPECIES: Flp family type IVb pilin [unclassified Bradyrhizobium]MBR1221770.1 Flp family type IVb pilin [Bradyrhizobium sp. U87765 SZCCT0131]MBR1264032.1 Flp family type IVb pilin [Bradyrhizobium sp. U87765 SZCCT0134]MBR1308185.1 Flp family type IVb pilin [Bradyrhizobium sp. U87765 SZCCT0110]MBR1320282.1 Flp family type IVb pilin [Bradyrhizobium sp. U87765 SZCCT0109]MBR1348605.1 Flp family type IVb pilin [Bradyrhizobium sp. U87765 SZCCT0048]
MKMLGRFWRCDSGATSIEYALIASGVSIVIAVLVTQMGSSLSTRYSSVTSAVSSSQ